MKDEKSWSMHDKWIEFELITVEGLVEKTFEEKRSKELKSINNCNLR